MQIYIITINDAKKNLGKKCKMLSDYGLLCHPGLDAEHVAHDVGGIDDEK